MYMHKIDIVNEYVHKKYRVASIVIAVVYMAWSWDSLSF